MTQPSAKDQAAEAILRPTAGTRAVHERAEADVPAALRDISERVRRLRSRRTEADEHRNRTRACLDTAARDALSAPGAMAVLIRFADEHELPGRRNRGFVGPDPDVDLQVEGATMFGCLLHLSGHPISAVFWWKFAAGAGDRTAATCLYLQHILRGDNRGAFLWLTQAIAFERAAQPHALPPTLPQIESWPQILPRLLPIHRPGASTPIPCADLAPALRLLVLRPDPDLDDLELDLDGVAGRPGPGFTRTLEALV